MASVRTDKLDLAALSLNIINDLNILGNIGDVGDVGDVGGIGYIGVVDLNYAFLCRFILSEGNSQRESHQEGEEHNSTGCFAHS